MSQELELMPMLNVFISIIPLLLLSAAFVQLAVIPTALPSAAAAPPPSPAVSSALALAVAIHDQAFVVEAQGAVLRTIARSPGAESEARRQLTQVLAGIAAGHPEAREVRIVADPTIHYEELIDVMDLARGAGWPEAALADAGA